MSDRVMITIAKADYLANMAMLKEITEPKAKYDPDDIKFLKDLIHSMRDKAENIWWHFRNLMEEE